jgi:hypothetical protein
MQRPIVTRQIRYAVAMTIALFVITDATASAGTDTGVRGGNSEAMMRATVGKARSREVSRGSRMVHTASPLLGHEAAMRAAVGEARTSATDLTAIAPITGRSKASFSWVDAALGVAAGIAFSLALAVIVMVVWMPRKRLGTPALQPR